MRGDMLWPTLMWVATGAALCWWSPPGTQGCSGHIPRVGEMVGAEPAVKESLTPRRDVVTRVGHPVEPIREDWGGWE